VACCSGRSRFYFLNIHVSSLRGRFESEDPQTHNSYNSAPSHVGPLNRRGYPPSVHDSFSVLAHSGRMKIRPAFEDAGIPIKPQLHTRKHHHAYNGARSLPIFTWVRPSMSTRPSKRSQKPEARDRDRYRQPQSDSRSTLSPATLSIYEVKLYYSKNRACTIYRSWDDFVRLGKGLSSGGLTPPPCTERHSHTSQCLHKFLKQVLARSPTEPSVEFFLRRRMDDCGGG